MSRIPCFFMEETGNVLLKLRRYHLPHTPDDQDCPENNAYHNAFHAWKEEPEERNNQGYIWNGMKPGPVHDDPLWPKQCACGYVFREQDEWQVFVEQLYRRVDTGEVMTNRDAPIGAMWYVPWADEFQVPQDVHNLMVKTPGGDWEVDAQARNCTLPDDQRQEKHHCWIRHGEPPNVTVDKDGITCGAGAGSIQIGKYHGSLRNGYLED